MAKNSFNCSPSRNLMAFIPAIITFLVYLPALRYDFVNWDDPAYVLNQNIRSMDLTFFKWAFTSTVAANWHPLTVMTYALDYLIWGLKPVGFHLTNIILHAMNTFLVACLALKLAGIKVGVPIDRPDKGSMLAATVTALFFGLHPMHVESVAWVSERKDVLYGFFFLLSLFYYIRHAESGGGRASYTSYTLSLVFFVLSLMSKPMAVTLPLVLLILDFYPLERIFSEKRIAVKRALIEKAPFFLLSALFSAIAIWAQGRALISAAAIVPGVRAGTAASAIVFYIHKIMLPVNLVPYYPLFVKDSLFNLEYAGSLALIIMLTAFCLYASRRKLFLAAWLYFVFTLIPVAGLVQVGGQAAADRYAYLPGLAPFVLFGAAALYLFKRFSKKGLIAAIVIFAVLTPALMAAMTLKQMGIWKDSVSLWSREIDVYPVVLAYNNRAKAYITKGEYEKAIKDYNVIIESGYKDLSDIYLERGLAYKGGGNTAQAIRDFSESISTDPGKGEAYYNLGISYLEIKDYEQAVGNLRKASELGFKEADEILRKAGY